MFYLTEMVHDVKLQKVIEVLIIKDSGMRENSMAIFAEEFLQCLRIGSILLGYHRPDKDG